MKRQTGISITQVAMDLLDKVAVTLGIHRSAAIEIAIRYYVENAKDFSVKE